MRKLSSIVLSLVIAIWITGCGLDDSSSVVLNPDPTPSQSTLSGTVAANLVSNATISAYSVAADGTQGQLLGSTETNTSGAYSLPLDNSPGISNILLVATGGSYVDEATNNTVNLTSMEAFAIGLADKTVNITPMSAAVWNTTNQLLSEQNLTQAFDTAYQAAKTYVGADLNIDLGPSLAAAIDSNNTDSMSNWLMLTAVSQYQADNSVTFAEAISKFSIEMSSGYPVYTLDGMPSTTIAGAYFQVLQANNLPVSRFDSSQVAYEDCNSSYNDFATQFAATPFVSGEWSGKSWGPHVASYSDQTVCSNYQWQRQRVMYAYENIAVTSKWNYCHHHSASWFPGKEYSFNLTEGAQNNSLTLEKSLYCSSYSFYDVDGKNIGGYAASLDFRNQPGLSVVNNAYRWNSSFAQMHLSDYNDTVSQETQLGEMKSFLEKLYPSSQGTLIDTTWFDYNKTSGIFSLAEYANFEEYDTPSGSYPRQSKNQFLNGLDCSDLTGWAYKIGLKQDFNTQINEQAGQPTSGHFANATAQQLCENPTEEVNGSAGSFVTYNGKVIDADLLDGNRTSSILDILAPGDLLFITADANSTSITHVITWTGKKVANPGTGVTNTTVALDLIAPSTYESGSGRLIGDWVIIDSHYQGADYRDFSGWYVNNLWGVKRVIGAQQVGCTPADQNGTTVDPLSSSDINLIFVVSPDINYSDSGDVQENTANLTKQGFNRSLEIASYLQESVLGQDNNVTKIYSLQPESHYQNGYPNMAALTFIQQFAMLYTTTYKVNGNPVTAYSTPINAGYSPYGLPNQSVNIEGVDFNQSLAGLSYDDVNNSNERITEALIDDKKAGYYVFSAPWKTISTLMTKINEKYAYNLELPSKFQSSNIVHAITVKIGDTANAELKTYKAAITPSKSYPTLAQEIKTDNACEAAYFSYSALNPKEVNGSTINTNQTVYFIRHAEAHPVEGWDDGNYIAAGQWRSLLLPRALEGKISPSMVFSNDPSQNIGSSDGSSSYVRPSLTAQPYAIANNLPYHLTYDFYWSQVHHIINYFFYNSDFSGKTILVAWEHGTIQSIMDHFFSTTYFTTGDDFTSEWGPDDYDSIWTVTLDADGNLNVKNDLCEGINSSDLPIQAPQF